MPEKKVSSVSVIPADSQTYTPVGSFLTRIYWMVFGHTAIGFVAYLIAANKFIVIANAAYLLLVALIIVVRLIDIQVYKGQTGDGEPATMSHWRRFSAIVIGYSIPLWVAAMLAARFKLI